MNFGHAIEALKQGKKVTRKGWNGNKPTVIPDYPNYTPTDRVEYKEEYDLVYILLSDGSIAVCDGCFYERVKMHNWSISCGYAYFTDNNASPRRTEKLHNFILKHTPSDVIIDHINGNKLDNRLVNLRLVSHKENIRNSGGKNNSTSSFKGVSWDSSRNKWIASIQYGGKTHHIGRFDNEEECAKAYDKECMRVYGRFAKLNFNYDFLPNMYLWLKPATTIKAEWCKDPMLKEIVDANGGEAEALGTICMKTADNKILTGWLASQTDMLSEDWMIIPSDAEIEEFYFVREPDHMIEYSRDIASWSDLDVIKQKHKIFKTKEEALEYQKELGVEPSLSKRQEMNKEFIRRGLHKEFGYAK